MPRRTVDLRTQRPLLDIASFGRRGPGARHAFTVAELAHAARTARGAPEVMVKVSGGARTLRSVAAHMDYIGRDGDTAIEADDHERLHEKAAAQQLLKNWDLDLEAGTSHAQRSIAKARKPPKLVHNIVLSMPEGTPPDKLQRAVRAFASDKFAGSHRYAMESHMVVRSGRADLGKWVSDERDIYADYKAHIGGPAKTVVNVWLLGVSLFQRRSGSCRFADMQISQPGAAPLRL